MAPDTVLTIGDITFGSFEVPDSIRFGGSQRLSVKEFIGGKRVIDSMGPSELPLEWAGVFTGTDALGRAQRLDELRSSGLGQDVSWGGLRYKVVVRDFVAEYQRFYRIPYRITCEVAENQTAPPLSVAVTPVDAAIQDDFNTASGLGGLIGDDTLSSLLGGLDTAISAVSSFATAAQSTINSVLMPLGAIQQRVTTLIGASTLTLQNVSTFGGVLPNAPFSQLPLGLAAQTSNMLQCNSLFSLRNICGRMSANLVSINNPQKTVATAGGNLFQMAQSQYGDATAWTAIARANGTTDPFVAGTATIAIPGQPDTADGVLNA